MSTRGANRRMSSWTEVAEALTEIPAAVKATRRSRALSLREAGEQCGLSFNVITRIEHGNDYNSRCLPALLAWLSADEPARALVGDETPGTGEHA
ncbi:MAG TPA: helix-turn-helix transcriptional regulator [Actinomycetes bacterium]|nr:helix-turn-helix transcriptional regulator [Actinomycetes bacterium]